MDITEMVEACGMSLTNLQEEVDILEVILQIRGKTWRGHIRTTRAEENMKTLIVMTFSAMLKMRKKSIIEWKITIWMIILEAKIDQADQAETRLSSEITTKILHSILILMITSTSQKNTILIIETLETTKIA